MEIRRNYRIQSNDNNKQSQFERFKSDLLSTLFLRPHGCENLTASASASLSFAWIIILMMAGLEGTVWSLISRHLTPNAADGLKTFIGALAFLFIFCLIWITDASLIMFQRKHTDKIIGPFNLGLISRIAIVAISLFITAPFLNQAIREDDIFKEFDADRNKLKLDYINKRQAEHDNFVGELHRQLDNTQRSIDQDLKGQEFLSNDIKNIVNAIAGLDKKIAEYKAEVKLQYNGGKGVLPGQGPKYLKAKKNLELTEQTSEEARTALKELQLKQSRQTVGGSIIKTSAQLNNEIDEAVTRFTQWKLNAEAMSLEVFADAYGLILPENNLGKRIQLLDAIKMREQIPHWQSTEGLAQALLMLLFLSLLSIKFFEPESVRLYFDEELQIAWKRYLNGLFDDVPEFAPVNGRRMAYIEFTKQYEKYDYNPDRYFELYNEKLLRQYKIEEQRAELELKRQEQYELAKRSEIEIDALKNQLEQELKFVEIEKQQTFDTLKRESELRLAQLELEVKQQKLQSEREHYLAEQRMRNELEREQQQLAQQITERKAEIETQKIRLELERLQAEKELTFREQRLLAEIEMERQNAAQETIERNLAIETRKANLEADRQRTEKELLLREQRLRAEIDAERHKAAQEIAARTVEIEARKTGIELQRLQAEKELTLREQRLNENVAIERQKLEAAAKEQEARRRHEEHLVEYEIEKQKRADRIAAIQEEIARVEMNSAALKEQIKKYQEELDIAHKVATEFEEAKSEPERLKSSLAELERRLKRARETLNEHNEDGADDETIARARTHVKKLNDECKKLQQQLAQYALTVDEPTQKYNETKSLIAELELQKNLLNDQLSAANRELDLWREKRRELI